VAQAKVKNNGELGEDILFAVGLELMVIFSRILLWLGTGGLRAD
jgi:hypothetical protein